jgi:hypothetical protein
MGKSEYDSILPFSHLGDKDRLPRGAASLRDASRWQRLRFALTPTNRQRSRQIDRTYLNQFMKEVSPYIEYASRARSDAEKKFNESVAKESEGIIALGCTIPLVIGFCLMSAGFPFNFFISISLILTPVFIAVAIKKLTIQKRNRKIEKLKATRDNAIAEAENRVQWAISEFRNKHQSIIES